MAKKESKESKEETPKRVPLTEVFKPIMEEGVESKEQAVEKVMAHLESIGQTENIRGNTITPEALSRHMTNIMRDISTQRKGWWSNYEIVEEENLLQWKKKE